MMGTHSTKQTPVTLHRDELYRLVWEVPMLRLGERFGISGNGLAKICRRLDIPYPPRGHWAKKEAGKKVTMAPLPAAKPGIAATVTISPTPPPDEADRPAPDMQAAFDKARDLATGIRVPERLTRPHPLIAGWLADHERRKKEARHQRDPWAIAFRPAEYSEQDRRRHRILDALFKELERQGARIKQGEKGVLVAVVAGQDIEFDLREKHRQIKRPLTEKEKRWETWNTSGMKQELQPSGFLVFTIKTWLDGTFRREWLEKEKTPMEGLLPEIVATLMAAGPFLAERRKKAEEEARLRAMAERKREEERQRRKKDDNRWRRFVDIASAWRETEIARDFLDALKHGAGSVTGEVDGKPLAEWIGWAEQRLQSANPLSHGTAAIFEDVAQIEAWSYRD